MMTTRGSTAPVVVLKIGGRAFEREGMIRELGHELSRLSARYRFVLVHGGGAAVTELSRTLGIESVFEGGIRMTSRDEMRVVDMVLSGALNKQIVRDLHACGVAAVGLSGSDGAVFLAEAVRYPDGSRSCTGRVVQSDPRLLELLLSDRFLPVLASTSMTPDGLPMNVNADEAALAVAEALRAETLVFISDTPGVLRNGVVLADLTPDTIEAEISACTIQAGMIPKVRSAAAAVRKTVGNVVIGEYSGSDGLTNLLEHKGGTRIHNE